MAGRRRALILEGAEAASAARERLGLDLIAPIDIYAAAKALDVRVRFLDISMEGFYLKGPPPRVMLSALRPLARRAFTCAHEIGHHWFGHGSTIDELQDDERSDSQIPEEVLANAFASFMLMPTIGLRRAFSSRGWKLSNVTPAQMLTVASEFGVGYRTLLAQLSVTLNDIQPDVRAELEKWTPQEIRQKLLGKNNATGLVILDESHKTASVDLEQGYALAVPTDASVFGAVLTQLQSIPDFDVYRAVSRGKATVTTPQWEAEARVAPKKFIGPAEYRFLEDPDE